MTRKILAAATALTAWAVLLLIGLLVALLVAGPAHAHHRDTHSQGGGKQSSANDEGATTSGECEQPSLHPSGKDRCESPGGSGAQGKAKSDPDDDGRGPDRSNGGPDKPGGSGGVYKSDQDGNNGCGNDQDFEDDNEGLCLGPVKRQNDKPKPARPAPSQPAPPGPSNPVEDELAPTPDEVLGEVITRPAVPPDDTGVSVLGGVLAAPEVAAGAGETLPVTGASLAVFLLWGLALITSGAALSRLRR